MFSTRQTSAVPPEAPPHRERSSRLRAYRHDSSERGTVIALVGELDLDATALLIGSVGTCLRSGARVITVDLSALTFCDIGGLNAFLAAAGSAGAAGGRLRLENPTPAVARLFALTGTANALLAPAPPVRTALAVPQNCPDLDAR
ncbi:STAS domain-containing protein [Streptacidiphilus cavernicola]|uniref:STAS domain-containing protein n=1 Tax=Streptacidiphilus cavernicola TaxID=3342716 RepID=A0ABV6VQ57_9ACTN